MIHQAHPAAEAAGLVLRDSLAPVAGASDFRMGGSEGPSPGSVRVYVCVGRSWLFKPFLAEKVASVSF